MMVAILVLALLAQDSAHELVERLGSESLEEREEAVRRLKLLGKPALPELEKAAKSGDLETATRAKSLLRLIPIQDWVTPHLLQVMPGLEQRLSLDDPHTWTEVLIEAMQLEVRRHMEYGDQLFKPGDLEALAPLGLRGAATKQEKEWACSAVVHLGLRSAAPEVAKLLDDPNPEVRACALETLKAFASPLGVPGYRRALRDPDPNVQARACEALADLRDRSSIPEIAPLLKSESPFARGQAARALARLGAAEHAKAIGDMLEDKDSSARFYAVQAVADLGTREEATRVRTLLRDPDPDVRFSAIRTLVALEGRDGAAALMGMMDDRIPLIREAAVRALCGLGVREAVPRLLDLGSDLEVLNGRRRPEAWTRLCSLKFKEPVEGTIADLRVRLEKEVGLKIAWPDPAPGEEKWLSTRMRLERNHEPIHPVEALRYLVYGMPGIIVETDRIRFVSEKDAEKFWREWWAAEQKKKK